MSNNVIFMLQNLSFNYTCIYSLFIYKDHSIAGLPAIDWGPKIKHNHMHQPFPLGLISYICALLQMFLKWHLPEINWFLHILQSSNWTRGRTSVSYERSQSHWHASNSGLLLWACILRLWERICFISPSVFRARYMSCNKDCSQQLQRRRYLNTTHIITIQRVHTMMEVCAYCSGSISWCLTT